MKTLNLFLHLVLFLSCLWNKKAYLKIEERKKKKTNPTQKPKRKNPAANSSSTGKEKDLVCKKRKERKRGQYDHSYAQWGVNLSRERIDGKTKKRKTERKCKQRKD